MNDQYPLPLPVMTIRSLLIFFAVVAAFCLGIYRGNGLYQEQIHQRHAMRMLCRTMNQAFIADHGYDLPVDCDSLKHL
jgi:hypothetical protein